MRIGVTVGLGARSERTITGLVARSSTSPIAPDRRNYSVGANDSSTIGSPSVILGP
jgi:hypothetical protein